jgi:hypothetical protein
MILKSGCEVYYKKIIVSGDVAEVYEYENAIIKGFKSNGGRHHQFDTSDENKVINRDRVLSKAQKEIRRIVNSNFNQWGQTTKFLTLTFSENVTDIDKANYEFKKFRQRLEYRYNIKLKYTVVPELQKRGAVHYHLVLYNLPFVPIREIQEIWSNGITHIEKIEQVDNVGAYICKYLTKETANSFKGKKCYFNSRGLKKSKEIRNEKEVDKYCEYLSTSKRLKYQYSFTNDYTGKIQYKQYIK